MFFKNASGIFNHPEIPLLFRDASEDSTRSPAP